MTRLTRLLVLVMVVALAGTPVQAERRTFGDITTFATLPYPGQPGGIVVDRGTVYVDTFAFVVRPTDAADYLFAYDVDTGRLRQDRPNPIAVPRTRPVCVMGLSGLAVRGRRSLYVVDMNGRVLRVDPRTGRQRVYATFPAGAAAPASTMPLDIVFDAEGYGYVTDIGGAPVVWRVPRGGGQAEAWFVDPRIAGWWSEGGGGIRIDPTGRRLYFVVVGSLSPLTPAKAVVYRLPLATPTSEHLEMFHTYASPLEAPPLGAGPLGIEFGASGNLYLAMPGASAVSVLAPDGRELHRIPLPAIPQFLAFRGNGSLLVTTWGDVNAGPWDVLDVYVGDVAARTRDNSVSRRHTSPAARPSRPALPGQAAGQLSSSSISLPSPSSHSILKLT